MRTKKKQDLIGIVLQRKGSETHWVIRFGRHLTGYRFSDYEKARRFADGWEQREAEREQWQTIGEVDFEHI